MGPRFTRALTFASEAHVTQRRKGTDIPYIAHLLAVSALVIEARGDEDAAIAALLHDAVEDQGGAPMLDRIRDAFGREVADTADVAWATLAGSLASCLADLQEDECLILAYKRANYFVQFATLGNYGVRAEASSNTFIEPDASLIDDQYAKMAELGWQRATELRAETGVSDDPDGSPNFFVDSASPVNHAAFGQLAVATFRTVYGVRHPGQLQYSSFGEDGTSIRFPTLGLLRQRA